MQALLLLHQTKSFAVGVFTMKVAMISEGFLPNFYGGIEHYILRLTEELKALGLELTIFTQSYNPKLEQHFLATTDKDVRYLKNLKLQIPFLLKDFDIVHFHNYTRILGDILLSIPNIENKLISTHGGLSPYVVDRLSGGSLKRVHDKMISMPLINRNSKGLTVFDGWEFDQMLSLGVREELLHVLPVGIPDYYFINERRSDSYAGEKYILTVARLHPRKRIEDVISILPSIPRDINYYIIGGGDEKYRSFLINVAKESGVADRLKFLGNVSEERKIDLLRGSLAFVQSSLFEIQSASSLEAMALQVPTIVASGGSMSLLVRDYENGFIFSPGDKQALIDRIDFVISNPSSLTEVCKRAREEAVSHRFDKIAVQALRIYQSVLQR